MYICIHVYVYIYVYTYSWNPFLIKGGVGPSKNWVIWGGGGVQNFLLEREIDL